MGKTSFKNTKDLIGEISKEIEKLEKGELNLNELDQLARKGQSLYEQLIILRYKAFDIHGEPGTTAEEKPQVIKTIVDEKVIPDTPEETPFDFTNVNDNAPEVESQPSFDFSIDEPVSTTKIEEEEISNAKPKDPEPKNEPKEPSFTLKQDKTEQHSLNDVLKQSEDDLSLRKKFQNTPISDIKSNISIAKKFEYISTMFDNDAETYEQTIDFLNTCASGDDARMKLNELTTKYNWNLEDKSIIKFIELVERRYL